MRKIFSLFVTLVAAIAMNATVVTLNPSDFSAASSAATSAQVSGVTASITSGTITADQIRIFKNQTITISCEKAISAIVFNCTAGGEAQYGPGCFEAQDGYSYDGKIGTWLGTSTSVSFKASTNQVRATKIEVYLDGETPGAVVYDTLSIAQAITMASALEDNTTTEASYVIDGYAVNVYAYSTQYNNQDFFLVENPAMPDSVLKVYRATPMKDGKAYPVVEGDQVRLLGNLMKYVKDGKTQLEITNTTLTFLKEAPRDTTPTPPAQVDTITVAKALEIGKALADKAVTPAEYVIKGYSCGIEQAYDTTYKNETFWISDTKGTRTSDKAAAFYVYRCKPNTAAEIGLDALIQIKCKIKNYSGTIENDGTNIEFEVLEQGVIEIPDTISVADAIALAQNLTPSTKDNKYPTEKSYVIKGYVSEIVDYYDTQYKNETFWVTDEKGQRTSDKNLAFEVYRGKPNPAGEVGLDAYVQFTCKIINFGGTVENYDSNMEVKVLEPGKPVVIDTVTVAEALEIGNALADNAYTDNPYVVIGYVTKAYEPDSGYTSQNFYMADDPDARGEFYAYRSKPDAKINQGDYVQLFGKIQKYVGTKGTTIELSYGTATHVEAPKLDTLTVAEVQALNLAEGATTEERYIILAYVAEVTSPYEDDLESFILSDDAAATAGALNCIDAEIAAPGAALHDYVKVVGKISKVNGAFRMVGAKAYNLTRQDIQNIVLTEKAQKIMVDGVIYIIRDNKIYNLQGTQVR